MIDKSETSSIARSRFRPPHMRLNLTQLIEPELLSLKPLDDLKDGSDKGLQVSSRMALGINPQPVQDL